MSFSAKPMKNKSVQGAGALFCPIFTSENTPIPNCSASLGIYQSEVYPPAGTHDDNEGFFVVEGIGKALIGAEEYELTPHTTLYAPAGVAHSIKKEPGSQDLKIFLYHFPK